METKGRRIWISLQNVRFQATIMGDAWGRQADQPVELSVKIPVVIDDAAETDDFKGTIDYSVISRHVQEQLRDNPSRSMDDVFRSVVEVLGPQIGQDNEWEARVSVSLPSALLMSNSGVLCSCHIKSMPNGAIVVHQQTVSLRDIRIPCIIGIKDRERRAKQIIVVSVDIDPDPDSVILANAQQHARVANAEFSSAWPQALATSIFDVRYYPPMQ
jgi:FolB domain-containing protein